MLRIVSCQEMCVSEKWLRENAQESFLDNVGCSTIRYVFVSSGVHKFSLHWVLWELSEEHWKNQIGAVNRFSMSSHLAINH